MTQKFNPKVFPKSDQFGVKAPLSLVARAKPSFGVACTLLLQLLKQI